MTTNYTKNFALALPDFRSGPLHDWINGDITKIDQLLYGAMSQVDALPWANNTAYTVGTTVTDTTDATTWMCAVANTSAATGTFAADRAAHPTYWTKLLTGFAPRGEWTQGTQYFPYDLAYDTAQGIFGLCTTLHVSNTTGTIKDDSAYWSFLVDFSGLGSVSAVAVSYSHTASHLNATNVQAAIDEVETQIVSLNNVNISQGTDISNRVRYDINTQGLNTTQQQNARTNINAQVAGSYQPSGSYQIALGYTPVNRAGDTMTGNLTVQGSIVQSTNGGLTVQGWSGNAATGLIFFGNSGMHYLYYDGSASYTFQNGHVYAQNGRLAYLSEISNLGYQQNTRLAYAADFVHNLDAGLQEPYVGAVITGINFNSTAGSPPGTLNIMARYRWLQISLNNTWYTVGAV